MIVELDADSIVYRIGGTVDMLEEGKKFCERLIDTTIQNIYEDTMADEVKVYLGTNTNFRIQAATMYGYKANRSDKERPQFYDAIRAYLVHFYGAVLVKDQEAEDEVGIQAYKYKDFNEFIIGAIDKDMRMIVGYHYNYIKRKIEFIDKYQAIRNFYVQMVTGDMTDNIPGLYHHLLIDNEEEKAKKFKYSRYKSKLIKALAEMDEEVSMYKHVLSIYEEQGQLDKHGLSRILEISALLWIRRSENQVWVPPTERDFNYIDNDTRERAENDRLETE